MQNKKRRKNLMKKIISIFIVIAILSMITLVPISQAAALDTIDVKTNKTTRSEEHTSELQSPS